MFTLARELRPVTNEVLWRSTVEVRIDFVGFGACSLMHWLYHRYLPVCLFLSEDRASHSSFQGKQTCRPKSLQKSNRISSLGILLLRPFVQK